MSEPSGNAFKTAMLFMPLIAVPLIAVFGLPDLSKVSASLSDREDENKRKPGFARVGESRRDTPHDLFAPYSAEAPSQPHAGIARTLPHQPRAGSRSHEWAEAPRFDEPAPPAATAFPAAPEQPATAWPAETNTSPAPFSQPAETPFGQEDFASATPSNGFENSAPWPGGNSASTAPRSPAFPGTPQPPATPPAAAPLGTATGTPPAVPTSWSASVSRLKQLGIRHYQMIPGEQPNQFRFSCLYSSPTNPQKTYRFEAEEAEMVTAVQSVIRQIDTWELQQRRANR